MGSAPDVAIQQALEGTAEFFTGRKTRAAVVARRLLGIPDSDDDDLTDQLIRERRRRTRRGNCFSWVAPATTRASIAWWDIFCPVRTRPGGGERDVASVATASATAGTL